MGFFKARRADFFALLLRQARTAVEGLRALTVYMREPTPDNAQAVRRGEEAADEERRQLIEELDRTFVTPIDREDINNLSRVVDDMIDYGKSTVDEMTLLKVAPDKPLVLMSEALLEAACAVADAIEALPRDRKVASERVIFAKKRENYMEHCYREALVELFENKDVVHILKVREIYRHLSNAADRADEAADIVGGILVKTV